MTDFHTEHRCIYITDLNPEPWTPGILSMGFKGKQRYPKLAKNGRLTTYQEGIEESIKIAYPDIPMFPAGTKVSLHFKFWRRLDEYTTEKGRESARHVADATNMQKALEDALQKILFVNDNQVKLVSSEIMEEGPDVRPRILIYLSEHSPTTYWINIADQLDHHERPNPPGNVYYTKLIMQ